MQPRKDKMKNRRSRNRVVTSRYKEIERYLNRVEFRIRPDAPKTVEELRLEIRRCDIIRPIWTFTRHQCTNYDEVVQYIQQRWSYCRILPPELKSLAHHRVRGVTIPYLVRMGWFNQR